MYLLPLLVTMCVTLAVFGRSVDQVSWEDEGGHPTTDEKHVDDRFAGSTAKSGTSTHGSSGDYIYVQRKPSDNSPIVKTFIDRIVGGTQAKYGEIPWQALVKINCGTHFCEDCGAVIIDHFWLLSAAHCFDENVTSYRVTVGEYNLSRKDAAEQTFEVDHIYSHEHFIWKTLENDIALIRIKPLSDGSGITFNRFVQSIRLPDATSSLQVGTPLLVSGWGSIDKYIDCQDEANENAVVLMKAEVPLVDQETCRRLYSQIERTVPDSMLCAGYLEGGADACYGDSGGPLVYRAADSNVLVGIVSWGRGCGKPDNPGVYTRVTSFLDWINGILQNTV